MKNTLCLETKDYEGKDTIFTEEQRKEKVPRHPELLDLKFINGRVKKTIQNPDFVYEDLAQPDKRRVHYLEEYKINKSFRYTKVVIDTSVNPLFVVTAFRPASVKERGKTKLLYGKDNQS